MPTVRTRFQPVGPVLVRASTDPDDLDCQSLPDLTNPAAILNEGLAWLGKQWSRPEVAEAIGMASPDLAAQVGKLLAPDAARPTAATGRRAILATASYLIRWQRRATPFGLFAAVTTATVGPTRARIGDRHRAVARADAEWLTHLIDRLEQHHELRRRITVVADSSGLVRDGRFVIATPPQPDARTPGPVRETSTKYTRAVQLALAHAATPVRFDQLAAHLAALLPHIDPARIDTLLHGLIDGRFLITSLRPPMTTTDGLAHVIEALYAADAASLADIAPTFARLRQIHAQLRVHNASTDLQEAAHLRATVSESMAGLAPAAEHTLAVDLRLDAQMTIPQTVLDEASGAADLLLRLSTQPFGSTAWLDYHTRFRNRYGPGALVPVRELVADSALGYPTGFLGAPRARPAWRMLTERDVHMMTLIQKALLDGADEIRLTGDDIAALTVGDHTTVVPPPRIELGFAATAATADALDRGDFELRITGAPRTPTSMAGRFAYLLDPSQRQQLAETYNLSGGGRDDVIAVQVSFPPRRVHNENVVRVGKILPEVIALSEHPDGPVISVDDLGVTADADQLYLVQLSTGRRVIPSIPHALDTTVQTPPLARFIAEVADARSAVFGPFDPGAAARNLPYLPRIRYRRTILAPARWLLTADDLTTPPSTGEDDRSTGDRWEAALSAWRRQWRVPARVIACHGELRLPLDLDQPVDRALLRSRLDRATRLELREDTPDGPGWVGRPAEFLIALTPATPPARRPPITAPPGRTSYPGASTVVHAQLVGNPARADHLLTAHVPMLADSLTDLGVLRWWIKRHRDTIRIEADQHLSLFFQLSDPSLYGAIAARLAEFAAGLAARGLPAELTLAPYHQHPARYGHGPALEAAEQVFATDTTAAISQLRAAEQASVPAQALGAASMTRLAAAFAPDPHTGYRALLTCLQNVTTPAARTLTDLARHLGDPTGEHRNLRALPGGDAIADAWQARDIALRTYHDSLRQQRDPADILRTLLHEHHVRAVGVDPEFERKTNHAARAAAMRCLAKDDVQ
jgi:thiopeptide-type bacteriocin biosynthesis protein